MVAAGLGGSVGGECEVDQDDRGWRERSGPVGHIGRAGGCTRCAERVARLRRYGHLAESFSQRVNLQTSSCGTIWDMKVNTNRKVSYFFCFHI